MSNTGSNWLVIADVDAVQSWIFSSIRLREIAGASRILTAHDEALANHASSLGVSYFSAGGTTVAAFERKEDAESFSDLATRSLRQAAITATATTSTPVDIGTFASFKDALGVAVEDLETRKRQGHDSDEPLDLAFARRCESCGIEPAVDLDETVWVGAACRAKRRARQRSTMLESLFPEASREDLPADFQALAGEVGEIGILVADVNGVGERLRADAFSDEKAYAEFSKGLHDAVRATLVGALRQVIGPVRPLPFEVLYLGGDDLVLACRGNLALDLLHAILSGFAAKAGVDAAWTRGRPLGMSGAAAIVGPGFPFRVAHRIAAGLLSAAKREARREDGTWARGTLDFVRITASHATPEAILQDRVVTDGGPTEFQLTVRPLRIDGTGWRSFVGLRDAAKTLANGFPRNKLARLREIADPTFMERAGVRTDPNGARKALDDAYRVWVDRVRRRPDAREAWSDACKKLGIDQTKAYLQDPGGSAVARTALADLADVVGVWGL